MKQLFGFIVLVAMLSAGCDSKLDYKKTKGGMAYQVWEGKGKKLKAGEFAKVHYIQKINDSVVYNSFGKIPYYFQIDSAGQTYDPSEVFAQSRVGDSIITIQLIDTFMKRMPGRIPPNFKAGDKIISQFKILESFANAEAYSADVQKEQDSYLKQEVREVEAHLAKNNLKAQKVGKGTYVEIRQQGSGPLIDSGKYVTVNYTGRTFAGVVFDSNVIDSFQHVEPLGFVVDQSSMIAAFHEGMKVLSKGADAVIYVPSMLGYGPMPRSPLIKPYEHLIFDVKVLDVLDKAPPNAADQLRQ